MLLDHGLHSSPHVVLPHTHALPCRRTSYGEESFEKEFPGLKPSQFADILALMGDASDNIPGEGGRAGLMVWFAFHAHLSYSVSGDPSQHRAPSRPALSCVTTPFLLPSFPSGLCGSQGLVASG